MFACDVLSFSPVNEILAWTVHWHASFVTAIYELQAESMSMSGVLTDSMELKPT